MPGKSLPSHSPSPEQAESLNRLIQKAECPLLVTHVAPDGDAIGSLLGLGWLLRALGKDMIMACQDPMPYVYDWLPGSSEIVQRTSQSHDLVISLD